MRTERTDNPCPRCPDVGHLVWFYDTPHKATGSVVAVLGFLLAPLLIGIPIVVLGLKLAQESHSWWQCDSCGVRLPDGR